MDINNRVAVVTGGARRVGRAIALALADAGASVFVHYNSSAGPAEETLAEIERRGGRGAIGAVNLGHPEVAADLIAMATEALGEVSILVNSASGFATDTIDDVDLAGWKRSHDLTLASPVFLTQAFAAALGEDSPGAVLNVTDVRTQTPYLKHFSYVIAKGGLDTFTRAAAVALAPRIRVNAVALGVILPPPGEDAAYVEGLAADLPLQRVGGTDPVVAAALHLIQNDFVTGEIIRLDGGAHLT
ncbi:MAG: SDR family oxidoreductase [Acidimicrobiia bacterium]|nr:SDR family oxidoreductase [Acidimicrobiia bacterium]